MDYIKGAAHCTLFDFPTKGILQASNRVCGSTFILRVAACLCPRPLPAHDCMCHLMNALHHESLSEMYCRKL